MAQTVQPTTTSEANKNIGTKNTGAQSSAQTQSGHLNKGQKETTKQAGVERSTGDSNDGDFDQNSTRRTGETPSTNRGFSQTETGGQNEMSQRVAQNADSQIDKDEFDETPHRKDPSSINQVNPDQNGGNSDGFPPDLQMNDKATSNRH